MEEVEDRGCTVRNFTGRRCEWGGGLPNIKAVNGSKRPLLI